MFTLDAGSSFKWSNPLARYIAHFSILSILALAALPNAVKADEVSQAQDGVVRVVVVTYSNAGAPVGIGHGSGFSVGPNKVVTSAHLFPSSPYRRPSIYVVSPGGDAPGAAQLVYKDSTKDLALLKVDASLPPLTIFDGEIADGADVIALGYPGNVDLATSSSLRDYLAPKEAVRSQGNFANRRTISGIDALLHTAAIAGGNSGGPLLDECGRVIGVNSFATNSGDGDAPFGFAISNDALTQFLASAGQTAKSSATPCLGAAERLAAEEAKVAQRERLEVARRAEERAELHSRERAAAALQRTTENWIAIAVLLGVASLFSFCAAGLLFVRDRLRVAAAVTTASVLLAISGVTAFYLRPTAEEVVVPPVPDLDLNVADLETEQNSVVPEKEAENSGSNDVESIAVDANEMMLRPDMNVDENISDDSASEDDPLWTQGR